MTPFQISQPTSAARPLLVSVPHTGVAVPEALRRRLDPRLAQTLPDTDWYLDQLYDFVPALGGVLLCAHYSRYVIDLNRAPDGKPLYPGRFETGLLPTQSFDLQPLYQAGDLPDDTQRQQRLAAYYRPYHAVLRETIESLRARFGEVLLFEAHSIRSQVPALFKGTLPDCVVGDNLGTSCGATVSGAFCRALSTSGYELSRNQPFRGGRITRQYGAPEAGVHALQLEMAQRLYLKQEAPPFPLDCARAGALKVNLQRALKAAVSTLE